MIVAQVEQQSGSRRLRVDVESRACETGGREYRYIARFYTYDRCEETSRSGWYRLMDFLGLRELRDLHVTTQHKLVAQIATRLDHPLTQSPGCGTIIAPPDVPSNLKE